MIRLLGLSARGIPLLRIRGVAIEGHWSLIQNFVWLPFWLAPAYRAALPDLSTTTITAMTLGSGVLLEASIVLHELGHAFQARREGMGAERVILWAFGGVAFITGLGRFTPGADIRVTAAGPLVTLVLAAVFGPLAFLASASGWPDWIVGLLAFLALINCFMLAFNLLPVFPLDGGRLLHATLWRLRGYASASVWTTRIGLAVAGSLFAAGVIVPFLFELPPLSGAFLMFNAALLLTATYAIRPPAQVRYASLRGRQVSDLLVPQPVLPAPEDPVGSFLDGLTREGGQAAAAYPVVDDGKVVGVISPGLASDALLDGRTVAEVMVRKEQAVMLTPEMSIEEAFAALGEDPTARGVVLFDGRVAGILRGSDLAEALLKARDSPHGSIVPTTPPRLSVDW